MTASFATFSSVCSKLNLETVALLEEGVGVASGKST